MAGHDLTREEARERARLLTVHAYEVELDLTTGEEVFASTTRLTFDARPGATTFLDLIARRVHRVELNGRELDVSQVVGGERVMSWGGRVLLAPLVEGESTTATIARMAQ